MKKLVLLFALTCIHALLFGYHSDLLEENKLRQDVILEDSKRDTVTIQLGDNPIRRGYIGLAIGPDPSFI